MENCGTNVNISNTITSGIRSGNVAAAENNSLILLRIEKKTVRIIQGYI